MALYAARSAMFIEAIETTTAIDELAALRKEIRHMHAGDERSRYLEQLIDARAGSGSCSASTRERHTHQSKSSRQLALPLLGMKPGLSRLVPCPRWRKLSGREGIDQLAHRLPFFEPPELDVVHLRSAVLQADVHQPGLVGTASTEEAMAIRTIR